MCAFTLYHSDVRKNLLECFDDNIMCRAAFIQDVNVTGYTSGFKDFISQLYKC